MFVIAIIIAASGSPLKDAASTVASPQKGLMVAGNAPTLIAANMLADNRIKPLAFITRIYGMILTVFQGT